MKPSRILKVASRFGSLEDPEAGRKYESKVLAFAEAVEYGDLAEQLNQAADLYYLAAKAFYNGHVTKEEIDKTLDLVASMLGAAVEQIERVAVDKTLMGLMQ